MAKKKIEEYTAEELRTKLKTLSNMSKVLLCIYGFLFVAMIVYCWMRNWEVDMKAPLIVSVGGLTTLLPLLSSRSALTKELATRGASSDT